MSECTEYASAFSRTLGFCLALAWTLDLELLELLSSAAIPSCLLYLLCLLCVTCLSCPGTANRASVLSLLFARSQQCTAQEPRGLVLFLLSAGSSACRLGQARQTSTASPVACVDFRSLALVVSPFRPFPFEPFSLSHSPVLPYHPSFFVSFSSLLTHLFRESVPCWRPDMPGRCAASPPTSASGPSHGSILAPGHR